MILTTTQFLELLIECHCLAVNGEFAVPVYYEDDDIDLEHVELPEANMLFYPEDIGLVSRSDNLVYARINSENYVFQFYGAMSLEGLGKKYDHAFSIGFSVQTNHDAEHVTSEELFEALRGRINNIKNCPDPSMEMQEACGLPSDTIEND